MGALPQTPNGATTPPANRWWDRLDWLRLARPLVRYGFAVVAAAAAFGLREALTAWFGLGFPTYLTFYPAVMTVALLAGFGPGLVATLVSGALVTYWVLPPVGQWTIASPVDRVALMIFVGMGLFMSVIAELYRRSRVKAAAYDRDAALRESVEQLRLLSAALEAAANGIAITDLQGTIQWVNPAFTTLTGYGADEAIGQNPRVLKSGMHSPEFYRQIWETIMRGDAWHGEIINRRKDKTLYMEEMMIAPVRAKDGKIANFIAVKQDVTERKRAEDEIRRLNAELGQRVEERTVMLEKTIAELEAFSYSLAHDLRAPLRTIQGFLQIIVNDHGKQVDGDGIDLMQRVVSAAQRMDQMIVDLTMFTRITHKPLVVAPIDVEKLIREIILDRTEFQPPKAEITVTSPLPEVMGNEASLVQCFTNLLGNAVKFVAPGVKPEVHIYSECKDSKVRLWCVDNGIGMDGDTQQQLFKLFQRHHGADYPGTGIGLAIVRKATDRMGGKVGIESEVGKGSRFWLELPAVKK